MTKQLLYMTLLAASFANATPMFSDAGTGGDRTGDGFTLGVRFTVVTSGLFLTDLGIYDKTGNALATDHEIGLWDVTAGNILIADATILAGTTNSGVPGFVYVSLGAYIPLINGDEYRLGAYYPGPAGTGDHLNNCCSGTAPTVNPGFSIINGAFEPTGAIGHLAEPIGNAGNAYVGPNLLAGPAPEPATLILSAAGLALVAGVLRLRRS